MALVTLVRARLHPECGQVSDTLLQAALDVAECKVLQLVGQSIGLAEHTDTISISNSFMFWLSQLPVVSITSAEITDRLTGDVTVIDPTNLEFEPKTGEVRYVKGSTGYFSMGWRNMQVVYNAGVATAPEIVQEAIIAYALAMVEASGTSNMLALGAEAGDYAGGLRAATGAGIPPLIMQMLHDYLVPGVGNG